MSWKIFLKLIITACSLPNLIHIFLSKWFSSLALGCHSQINNNVLIKGKCSNSSFRHEPHTLPEMSDARRRVPRRAVSAAPGNLLEMEIGLPPRLTESEILKGGTGELRLSKPAWWFWRSLKFENHWLRKLERYTQGEMEAEKRHRLGNEAMFLGRIE